MRFLIYILIFLLSGSAWSAGWVQKADFGGVARHRTTMITIDNKIYTGLGHYNGAGPNILFDDWWEYDPATNAWTQKADYAGGICYHAVGFSHNGIGYVGTGRISPSGNTLVSTFFKYDPSTNNWTQTNSLPGIGRRGAVAFKIGNYAYVGTGESTSGSLSDFYRLDLTNDTWTPIGNFPGGARNSSVAFDHDGYGYVGTGNTNFGSSNDFWRYNPGSNNWTQLADVGPTNRQEATGFVVNNKGYIGTGDDFSSGNNFSDFWEYDFSTDTWIQIEDFQGTARRYLSATTLNNVAYAGLGTNGTNFKDFWVFDPVLSVIEKSLEDFEILVYPNPAASNCSIQIPEEILHHPVQLQIRDLNGTVVYTEQLYSKDQQFNLINLVNGIYFIEITYNGSILKTSKFVKLNA